MPARTVFNSRFRQGSPTAHRIREAAERVAFLPPWPRPLSLPRHLSHPGAVTLIPPFDLLGIVKGTGRTLAADIRAWVSADPYPFDDPEHLPPRRREALVCAGRCGAVAGLLVRAEAPELGMVAWFPWTLLETESPVPWEDERLVFVGDTQDAVDFNRVLSRPQGGKLRPPPRF